MVFDNVTFSYGLRRTGFKVSFTAKPLNHCNTGRTGSGKLYCSLIWAHDPQEGRIIIDGVDVGIIPFIISEHWHGAADVSAVFRHHS